MGLKEYWKKRNFKITPEPSGASEKKIPQSAERLAYVIQKHAASHLHYDFRLELNGVLKSWAVPKGPSLDPKVKRLAMHVEDHPLDYGDFEGNIPEGQYGAGTVMVWDQGVWLPDGDPEKAYKKGHLSFELKGKKLKGKWALIRMRARSEKEQGREQWLLMKEKDEEARSGSQADITESKPLSAVTGKDLDEIGRSKKIWNSNRNQSSTKNPKKKRKAAPLSRSQKVHSKEFAEIPGKKEFLPEYIPPELATLVKKAPEGDEWLHEIKFDGYRILVRGQSGRVKIYTRNENDWTKRFPKLCERLKNLPHKSFWLDGEAVVQDENGRSNFQLLQNELGGGQDRQIKYFFFDLLHLDGHNLREIPLVERKQLLKEVIGEVSADFIQFSDHVVGSGPEFYGHACKLALEGMVSKRAQSKYQSGRGTDWLKTKCIREDEFVIGGYTEPGGARTGFGALLVGTYADAASKLKYAGKVGTGFSEKTLKELYPALKKLEQDESPFQNAPRSKKNHWIRPELVAEIHYTEKTNDGHLRHPSFLGLREDKPAAQVREKDLIAQDVGGPKRLKSSRRGGSSSDKHLIRGIEITHPERMIFPDEGISKWDVAKYYDEISEWIMPHLLNRPVMIVRCPEGVVGECFFQKHTTTMIPKIVGRKAIAEKISSGETREYIVVDSIEALIALVQMDAFEFHVWGSTTKDVEHPDRMIFDLDPASDVPWTTVIATAKKIRDQLRAVKLESFVKTSGGKGLHIVVPLVPQASWEKVKSFSKLIADTLVESDPSLYISTMSKTKRKGKIFVDYLRNTRGATCVVAYSTRTRAGAPISTPLDWDELNSKIKPDQFTLLNIRKRLHALKSDPWAKISKLKQKLPNF